MSFQISWSKSLLDMDLLCGELNMSIVLELASVVRAKLYERVDGLFAANDATCTAIYNNPIFKPYWFRLEESGMTIGSWVALPDGCKFVYRSHFNALHTSPIPRKVPSGSNVSKVFATETGKLRSAYHAVRDEMQAVYCYHNGLFEKITDSIKVIPSLVQDVNRMKEDIKVLEDSSSNLSAEVIKDVADMKDMMKKLVHNGPEVLPELIVEIADMKESIVRLENNEIVGGSDLKDEVKSIKESIKKMEGSSSLDPTFISSALRTKLNALGKAVRSHIVIVHSAPYLGSPDDDAAGVLSCIVNLASFGEFKAFRRGRRDVTSVTGPLLAIVLSSELAAIRVLSHFDVFRRNWLSAHSGERPPFKIEQDLPPALVKIGVRLHCIVNHWRSKGFGDLQRHGEKIVYFTKDAQMRDFRVGEVPIPAGNLNWADPVLPSVGSASATVNARPSVYANS